MDIVQTILGGVVSLVAYAIILVGVYKVFQIHTEVKEIKDKLKDVQINNSAAMSLASLSTSVAPSAPPVAPPGPISGPMSMESAEAVLREVAQESQVSDLAQQP